MKNSTLSCGKIRSKISSVGVGHPRNSRNSAIVRSIARPASTPAQNPQISVLNHRLTDESDDELSILRRFLEVLLMSKRPSLVRCSRSELSESELRFSAT